jgi:hypothetical protein
MNSEIKESDMYYRKSTEPYRYYPGALIYPYAPQVYRPYTYTPNIKKPEAPSKNYVFNFNDPYEINSLADVILNEAALNRRYKGGFYDIPLLGDIAQRIVGLVNYTWDATLKPIIEKGDWEAAKNNLLNNLGETLDVVANPVKGLLMEGPEGFVKGIGLFTHDGRVNYNWDIRTGAGGVVDFIANFVAEFLSDPLNWVTVGGAALGKGVAKGAAKEAISESAELVAKNFIKEAIGDSSGKLAAQALKGALAETFGADFAKKFIAEFSDDLTEEIIQSVTHRLVQEIINPKYVDEIAKLTARKFFAGKVTNETLDFGETLMDAANSVNKRLINETVWKSFGKNAGDVFKPNVLTRDVMRITSEVINNRMTTSVLTGLQKFVRGTDAFERALLRGTLLSSGFGLGWYAGKAIIKNAWASSKVASNLEEDLTPFLNNKSAPLEDLPEINKVIDDEIRVNAAATKYDIDISPEMKGDIAIHLINKERRAIYEAVQLKTDAEEIMATLNKYTQAEKGMSFTEYLDHLEKMLAEVTEEQAKVIASHVQYMRSLWDNAVALFEHTDVTKTISDIRHVIKTFEDIQTLRRGFSNLSNDKKILARQFLKAAPAQLQEFFRSNPIFLAKYQRVLERFMKEPSGKYLNEIYLFFKKELGLLEDQIKAAPTFHKTPLALVETDAEGVLGKITELTKALEKARSDMKLTYDRMGDIVDIFPEAAQKALRDKFIDGAGFDLNAITSSNLPTTFKWRIEDAYQKFIEALNDAKLSKASKFDAAEDFRKAIYDTLETDRLTFEETGKHLDGMEAEFTTGQTVKIPVKDLDTGKIKYEIYETKGDTPVSILYQMLDSALYESPIKKMSLDDIIQNSSAYAMLDINADTVGYILKLSHVGAALKLYYSDRVASFLDAVNNDTELLTFMKSLEDAGERELVTEIRQSAQGIQLFKDLMEFITNSAELAVYDGKTTNMLKTALIDTLMTYSDTPLSRIARNLEYYKGEIKEKMTNQINGFQKHNLRLRNLIEENKLEAKLVERINAIDPTLIDPITHIPKYHDSTVDIIGTQLVAEEILGDTVPEGITRVYFDFETTGLDVNAGDRFMEISYRIGNEAPVKYRVQVPRHMAPNSEFVIKDMGYKSIDDFLEGWNSSATFSTEQEAVNTFLEDMFRLQAAGHRIQFAGQNIQGFDLKFLRSKLRSFNMGAALQQFDGMVYNTPVFDTFRALMKKHNYFTFEGYPEISDAIDAIVTNYITRRQLLTADSKVLPTFAEQVDKFMAFLLNILAKELRNSMGEKALGSIEMLQRTAEDILTILSDIKSTNLMYRNIAYIKEAIPAITDGSDIAERLFNINQLVAQNPEHLAMVSSKIVDNRPLIRQYFDIGKIAPKGQIDSHLAEQATELGRRLNRIRASIHNIEPLTEEVGRQYVALGEDLRAYLLKNYPLHNRTTLWAALKINGDNIKDTVAMVEYLYKEARTRAAEIKKSFDIRRLYSNLAAAGEGTPLGEAIHLLDEPKILRYTTSADNLYLAYETIDPDTLWKLVIKDDVADAVKYAEEFNERAAGLSVQEHILKKFGWLSDEHEMYRYGHQGNVAIQLKLIPTLREVNETIGKYMDTLSIAEKEALKDAIFEYGNARMLAAINDVLQMTPEQLQKHLWHRGLGLIRIDLNEFGKNKQLFDLVQEFLSKEKELNEAFIKVRLKNNALYLYPDATQLNFFKTLPAPEKFTSDLAVPQGGLPDEIMHALDKLQGVVNETTYNASYRSTGSLITKQNMQDLYLNVPPDIRKELVHLDDIVTIDTNTHIPHSLFNDTRFDYSNLGSVIDRKYMQQYRSINILKEYYNTVQGLMLYADTATKTRALFFSPSSGLQLKDLFKGIPEHEIFTELKNHPEYKLAMLVLDPSGKEGYIVKQIPVINADSIRYAKKMNAVILPESTYNMVDNVVRRKEISNAYAKWFSKYIVDPTKAGFLSSIGLLMRNTLDSTIKNLLSTGGVDEFGKMLMHTYRTARWLHIYDTDIKNIIELGSTLASKAGQHNAGMITEQAIEAYFAIAKNANRKDIFLLIHNFIMYGPSGGITGSTKKALEAAGRLQDSDLWTKMIWKNPYTKLIMDVNTFVEQTSRLAKYTYDLMAQGHTTAKAMSEVIKTHFEYSTKTKAQLYMELVVPFMTFTWNNIKYWWDALSQHGWIAGLARDVLIPLTELYEYDQYELQRNRSLQYAILNGSLRLDDQTNMTLKLSPSLLDAVNTMIDPIGALGERTIAPLRVPFEGATAAIKGEEFDWAKEAMTNLPFFGPTLQRFWGIGDNNVDLYDKGSALKSQARTGSIMPMLLPSVIGSIQRNYYFSYGGTIYMTHDYDKYIDHLLNGAKAIRTQVEAEEAYAARPGSHQTYPRRTYASTPYKAKKTYVRRGYARRRYPKRVYAKRRYAKKSYVRKKAFFHGTYVPRAYRADTFNRVMSATRNTQMRMPGSYRNLAYTAPALYRRIYTGTGTDKFKIRLMPVSYKNVKYMIRQDWAYLR